MKHHIGPILSLSPSRPETCGTIKRKLRLDLLFLSLDTVTLQPSPTSLKKGYLRIALEISPYLQAYLIYFIFYRPYRKEKYQFCSFSYHHLCG